MVTLGSKDEKEFVVSTRQTSIDAYTQMRDTGVLGKNRWAVYDWLYHHGPATPKQITDALTKGTGKDSDCFRPRLAELGKMGLAHTVGETVCEKTGRKVIVWDVTDKIVTQKFSKDPLTYMLDQLGFDTLDEYYKSDIWSNFWVGYASRNPMVCFITGRTDHIQLHHIIYDRLGSELDTDVVPLCREMHELVHKLIDEHKVPLAKAHLVLKAVKDGLYQYVANRRN